MRGWGDMVLFDVVVRVVLEQRRRETSPAGEVSGNASTTIVYVYRIQRQARLSHFMMYR